MTAADQLHSPTPEEVMEYLDGEGTVAARASIEAHLATCSSCQTLAAEQQHLSAGVASWQVDAPPASFRAPAAAELTQPWARLFPEWRRLRLGFAGLGVAAAIVLTVWLGQVSPVVPVQSAEGANAASAAQLRPVDGGGANLDAADSIVSRGGSTVTGGYQGSRPSPPQADQQGQQGRQFARMQQRIGDTGTGLEILRKAAVVRTASLRIVARDFAGVRGAVEGIIADAGGFIDQMTATEDAGSVRRLRGTLRVPTERLGNVTDRLRGLGQVVEDTQGSEDVGDQIVDLEARLASARATELRLTELLRNRTGKLSDVLDVERELARVRIDIERLTAQSTNLGRRVSYARLTVDVSEERKAGIEPGPLSLTSRLRVALADGLEAAIESVVLTVLAILRAGPQVLLWIVVLGLVWLILRRLIGSRLKDLWS